MAIRFQKLPEKSNGKFLRCLLVFFSLYIAKHGPEMLLAQVAVRGCSVACAVAHSVPVY
jgi:hypothetical protein